MKKSKFYLMNNKIQGYAWGSCKALSRLFDIVNLDGLPQAELWMGAHPNGCSTVIVDNQTILLSNLISQFPIEMLGSKTAERFGCLPFLFKVIAAEKALSVQVHPSKQQAEEGYLRENLAGLSPNAPNRNYRDDNHKPELVYALTPYQVMNGFRSMADILALFERISIPELAHIVTEFKVSMNETGLAHFFRALFSLADESKTRALMALESYASLHQEEETFSLITALFEQYPGDPGLFTPLLLNVVTLLPGQAMYLDACTPHAYIRGTALEIMASSDNVLRAGLTSKHIDLKELLACTRCVEKPADQILLSPHIDGGIKHFNVPVPDFIFSVYSAGEYKISTHSAEVIFVIDGFITLCHQQGDVLLLSKGQSVFVPASSSDYFVEAGGSFSRASAR